MILKRRADAVVSPRELMVAVVMLQQGFRENVGAMVRAVMNE
jgi:hypothetical protein